MLLKTLIFTLTYTYAYTRNLMLVKTFMTQELLLLLLLVVVVIFSCHLELVVFHWSLSDSKSPRIFRTLLSILVDFSSAEVWMVSILPLIFRSSNLFSRFLGLFQVPRLLLVQHRFLIPLLLCSLINFKYLSGFSPSFTFILWCAGTTKTHEMTFFFLSCKLNLGLILLTG